ncbi:hypothetical protein E2320_010790 [Naja naja]|nr:hypothetical protein E2320_010790 [Naja naja]
MEKKRVAIMELVPVDSVISNAAWKKVWSLCALKAVMILGDSGGSRTILRKTGLVFTNL